MKRGFKGLANCLKNDSFKGNLEAVRPLADYYDFVELTDEEEDGDCAFFLMRQNDTVIINVCGHGQKIDIHAMFDDCVRPEGRFEAETALLDLNVESGLRLGVGEDGRVSADAVVITSHRAITEEAFRDVFERHMNAVDAYTDRILQIIKRTGGTDESDPDGLDDLDLGILDPDGLDNLDLDDLDLDDPEFESFLRSLLDD